MAFGARQEDGIWRICERKGRTITHICKQDAPDIEIRFSGRSAAEKCTKELNETWWDAYRKKKRGTESADVQRGMIYTIYKNNGITAEEYERLK